MNDINNQVYPALNRREFLKKLTTALGSAATCIVLNGASVNVALAYTAKQGSEESSGEVFSQTQMLTLKHVVDTILPATSTPSASELDCHGFIDHQLFTCYTNKQQASFVECINFIDKLSLQRNKLHFHELQPNLKLPLLKEIEDAGAITIGQSHQFALLKTLLVFGYFTSQVGASQVLRYQAVPGGFKGSVKINDKTRAFGSRSFY